MQINNFICPNCRKQINKFKPKHLNPKANEIQCPKCKEWFCLAENTSSRIENMKPDNATERLEQEYKGTAKHQL